MVETYILEQSNYQHHPAFGQHYNPAHHQPGGYGGMVDMRLTGLPHPPAPQPYMIPDSYSCVVSLDEITKVLLRYFIIYN